jgi:hypothetical protein
MLGRDLNLNPGGAVGVVMMATTVGRVPRRGWLTGHHWFASGSVGRPGTSGAVPAEPHLADRERVLIRAGTRGGGWVVATERALYRRPRERAWARLGWEQITRIHQDRATGALVVTGLADGAPRRGCMPVDGGRKLLAFAQERVAATRLIVTRIRVDGRDVVIEGRRHPGDMQWQVHFATGLVPTDAALRGEIDRSLRELRSTLGV